MKQKKKKSLHKQTPYSPLDVYNEHDRLNFTRRHHSDICKHTASAYNQLRNNPEQDVNNVGDALLLLCFVINLNISLWNTIMVNEVLRKVFDDSTLNQHLVLPLFT